MDSMQEQNSGSDLIYKIANIIEHGYVQDKSWRSIAEQIDNIYGEELKILERDITKYEADAVKSYNLLVKKDALIAERERERDKAIEQMNEWASRAGEKDAEIEILRKSTNASANRITEQDAELARLRSAVQQVLDSELEPNSEVYAEVERTYLDALRGALEGKE